MNVLRFFHCFVTVAAGATIATAQIHVAPTGNDANPGTAGSPVRTINHAAAIAANGGTILVHAGSYGDEQGIVLLGSKDLVLQGDGAATTIVRPHTTLLSLLPLVQPGGASFAQHRTGVIVAGPARVHLRDLTIDATPILPFASHVAGVYLRAGADVVLDRVAVLGSRPPFLGGAERAVAVGVRGDVPTNPTTCVLRACTLRGFGDAGVRAVLQADVDAQETNVAGLRGTPLAPDQVGFWAQDGSRLTARHCRIGELAGGDGAAVRFDDVAAGCIVEGNRIGGAATGIDVRRAAPATTAASIRNNRVFAIDRALRVRGTTGLQIEANMLHSASADDPEFVSDDAAGGNNWAKNRYAVPAGTTSVAIPGGGNVDAAPAPGIADLGPLLRVPCGGAPIAVVVDDFDGDGHRDFATLDFADPAVGITVGLWTPSGHAVQASSFGGPGLRPIALVAGEFDGQPGRDLIALTAPLPPVTTGAAFWVFANNGAGTLTLLHQEPLAGFVEPTAIAQASFNANAVGDLVVLDLGAPPFTLGQGRTLLNDGTGTTWFATPLPIPFTASGLACATGDLDGDGKIDLAIAEGSATTGRVHWLRGNGVGGFIPGTGSPFALPANPGGVAIADYDADGDRDLLAGAVAGALPLQHGVLQVFENQLGTLVARPPLSTDRGPGRIVVADLDVDNLDGTTRPELLVLEAQARSIGVFGAREPGIGFVGGGAITAIDGPIDFAVADLDGDPYRDLIAAEPQHQGVAILHGTPSVLVRTYGFDCPGTSGRSPRLELRGAPGLPIQPNLSLQIAVTDALPFAIAVLALSGAPAPALLPCGPQIASLDELWIVLTDSNGTATINLPAPATPDFRGIPLFFEAGVFDPAASTSVVPGLSLTAGLLLRVGN